MVCLENTCLWHIVPTGSILLGLLLVSRSFQTVYARVALYNFTNLAEGSVVCLVLLPKTGSRKIPLSFAAYLEGWNIPRGQGILVLNNFRIIDLIVQNLHIERPWDIKFSLNFTTRRLFEASRLLWHQTHPTVKREKNTTQRIQSTSFIHFPPRRTVSCASFSYCRVNSSAYRETLGIWRILGIPRSWSKDAH